MTDQEHSDHLREVLKYCGGFHDALIKAWFKADGRNKRTLEEAFPYDHRIPIGKPPEATEDEACDMLYGVDNNQSEKDEVYEEFIKDFVEQHHLNVQKPYTMNKSELKEQLQTNLLQVFEDVNLADETGDVYSDSVRDRVLDHMCDIIIKTIGK